MFVRYVKFEDAKRLVDAVNNAKTQREHDDAKLILKGYRLRTDQEGLMWPCADLDLSLPDDGRPACCGEYLDWMPLPAENHSAKSAYWEKKAEEITLADPDCLEYFEHKLEQAIAMHSFYKKYPEARENSYSLTYAKKKVNELTKKAEMAKWLWGS